MLIKREQWARRQTELIMAMHPLRKQRLIVVLFIVFGASVAVALDFALRENINLFYSPADIAAGKAPVGVSIRAGGMVLEGSVKRDTKSLRVDFIVTDYQAQLPVVYTGILPDLFDEGQGVVASGALDDKGHFKPLKYSPSTTKTICLLKCSLH